MDDSEKERRGFRVLGRVQGVGFRWWTRATGAELGLRGSVRNCPDGSVEVQAQGTPAALAKLEEELWKGPPAARVDEVRPITSESNHREAGFEIRF